ncbi:MAG: flagellin, partial [Parvularculaceae bacterium]|nr:flagellin [Parvularculaceae bacterium]
MLLTNESAQTALRTLRSAAASLDITQSRISTGLKVAKADDNPAFFLVSTTQRSDIVKLQGARENLTYALGAVQTAQTAQSFIDNAINNIRSAVVSLETGTAEAELSAV